MNTYFRSYIRNITLLLLFLVFSKLCFNELVIQYCYFLSFFLSKLFLPLMFVCVYVCTYLDCV